MFCVRIDTRIYNNYLIISLNPDHISGRLCTNVKSPSDLLTQHLIFFKGTEQNLLRGALHRF